LDTSPIEKHLEDDVLELAAKYINSMASTTGIPERPPAETGENEPLLGRPGDASQIRGESILKNLVLGTASIAQFGVLLLFVLVWASVFTKPVILFSGHPLAQSLAILTLVQSILSLQPTHTAEQKHHGQWVHASLNLLAFIFLAVGVFIIEYNKIANNGVHFHSVHGYLGVITSIILAVQYLAGFTIWATPQLYGGVDNAKSLYKYHRVSGYVILILLLVTVASATQTPYNENVLKIKLWAVILLSVLILVGVLPRIQKQKLGFKAPSTS
jgi:cytochrome b-561